MTGRGALKVSVLLLALGAAVIGSWIAGAQAQEEAPPLVNTILTRHALETADGHAGVMLKAEFAPGAAFAGGQEITHRVDEFVFILEGAAVVTRHGEEPVTYRAGDSWYNDASQLHTLENASTTEPLTALLVLIGEPERLPPG